MEELRGLIFDIEEFAVFDGPGIRTTVFFKGCPLSCAWCHNPEGLKMQPERTVSAQCKNCGACREVCPSPDACIGCGRCIPVCPGGYIRMAGQWMSPEELAAKLKVNAAVLQSSDGGITFSGGECSMQTPFILAVRKLIPELHCAIETCGFAPEARFCELISQMDLVLFDIKHTDPVIHKKYTGADNVLIHKNLQHLIESGVPFYARIPVIPGVNDSKENFEKTAEWLKDAKNLLGVELLPYNRGAGAKYRAVGRVYKPPFDESAAPNLDLTAFEAAGIPARVL